MYSKLQKSPLTIAADRMLSVHDSFLSEMILTREQLQSGRSKELLVLLGRFTQQTREFSRAQEYLKEAIELDREDLNLWKMLGTFQYDAGEYEKSLASFEQLLALADEADAEVCLKLALVYIRQRKYEKAFDLLMYAVQRAETAIAWMALGVCCMRTGMWEEAEAALGHANEMDRWDATTWGYCAVLCARRERWVEGKQAVELAGRLGLRDARLVTEIRGLYEEGFGQLDGELHWHASFEAEDEEQEKIEEMEEIAEAMIDM
jgi:tetratricopeptide (TPR) repeat protein